MESPTKTLTAQQRADKLLARLKLRALEVRYGRISVEMVIHDGLIKEIELIRLAEKLRAD